MYSNKEMFPKKVTSSIHVGDEFSKKKVRPSRIVGKQFATAATGMIFSTPEYKSDPMQFGGEKYSVTQPAETRKLGFGSKNATVSGEFTNTMRTNQYREILKKELFNERKTKAAIERKMKQMKLNTDTNAVAKKKFHGYVCGRPMSDRTHDRIPTLFQNKVPTNLFDIGKEEFGGVTPICYRCARDTFFCRHRVNRENLISTGDFDDTANAKSTPRITGPYVISSESYGGFDVPAQRPEHGRRHTTMEFFDTVRGGSLMA